MKGPVTQARPSSPPKVGAAAQPATKEERKSSGRPTTSTPLTKLSSNEIKKRVQVYRRIYTGKSKTQTPTRATPPPRRLTRRGSRSRTDAARGKQNATSSG